MVSVCLIWKVHCWSFLREWMFERTKKSLWKLLENVPQKSLKKICHDLWEPWCNSSYGSLLPTVIEICENIAEKSPENEFWKRAISHEKVGQSWWKSNLICNSSYRSLVPTFIQICESIAKRSPENECDGQTDWRMDRQTDWRTECKPIVPSGFTGGWLITL